jgi:hypothetical protein
MPLTRYSLDLKQRKMVKTTAIVCAAAYVATMIVVLSHCIPMSHKWQIYPYPGGMYPHCLSRANMY